MVDLIVGKLSISGTKSDGSRRTYEFVYGQLASDRWEYSVNAINDVEVYSCAYTFRGDEQCLRHHIRRTVPQWRLLEGVLYMDRPLTVRRSDGPVFQFTYRRDGRGQWLYSIVAVGKRRLSIFDADCYRFKGSERALRKELRNTVNGWRYSHDAAKWMLDGLAIRRDDGRLFEFYYLRLDRGSWQFEFLYADGNLVSSSYHQFWGSERSLRSFLRDTVDNWLYSEAQETWYLGGTLVVKRTDGRIFRFAYSPHAATLTPTKRSDTNRLPGCLNSAASPAPGRDEVTWSYGLEAVDGEIVEKFSNDYVCSRLDKGRYAIYTNSDMYEHEGSEQGLRRDLQEFAEEWQYDEASGWELI